MARNQRADYIRKRKHRLVDAQLRKVLEEAEKEGIKEQPK